MTTTKDGYRLVAVVAGIAAAVAFLPSLSGCQAGDTASVDRVLQTVWGDTYALSPVTQTEATRFETALHETMPEDRAAVTQESAHFRDALRRIHGDYVNPVDDARLVDAAIQGMNKLPKEPGVGVDAAVEAALDAMMTSLDPHSAYLDPQELMEMQVATSGEFGGLGIEITQENQRVKVVSPIEDTPASRAGIQPEDVITHLDGDSIIGLSLQDAVRRMRGQPGTRILLTIQRGETAPFNVSLVRDVVHVRPVRWRLEGDIGYVRIASFSERAEEGLITAMQALWRQAPSTGLSGLVLDLRRNPGGLLDQSQAIADALLDDGVIVAVRGRNERLNRVFRAHRGDLAEGVPMVVLIDGGSASAAEIVASALQENNRAIVMGRRSYGKGSVQTISPLPWKGALKLTTQLYYAPSGRTIQGRGVTPDITIEEVETAAFPREADLPGALAADLPNARETHANVPESACRPVGKDEDRILGCALEYLNAGGEKAFLSRLAKKDGG